MPASSPAVPDRSPRTLPATMLALRLHPPGGVDALSLDRITTPHPGPGEVLVRVHAAAITRDELTWSTDRLPCIPSFEVSGVTVALGDGVDTIRIGDAVFGLTPFDREGVAAEFAAVPARCPAPKPAGLDHVTAAAVPMAGLTAWQALFDHGALRPGERVVITGAAGGVGHVAVQLARWRGAHVIAVAPATRHALLRQLGADDVVERREALRAGNLGAVDLVFDTTGGELLAAASGLLGPGGRIVTVSESPPPGVAADYFVVTPNREQLLELLPLLANGSVRVIVDSVFPIAEARAAFMHVAAREKSGKVVLRVTDESA